MTDTKARLLDQIKDELRFVSSDWGDDFQFEITEEDFFDDTLTVSVGVTHRYFPGMQYHFGARAEEGLTEIEMGEDSYYELDGKHFFAFLFFESEQKRHGVG